MMGQSSQDDIYKEALTLYRQGRFAESFTKFKEAAKQNHAGAQRQLSRMYEQDRGVATANLSLSKNHEK